MKTFFILLFILSIFTTGIHSQVSVYKPFKVDIGTTLDIPTDDKAGTGFGIYVEPRYGVNDRIVLGIRLECIFLTSASITVNASSVDIKYTTVVPVLLTGEYFFNTNKVRPFVGLGLGMYKKTLGGVSTSIGNVNIGSKTETKFGFAPKMGINSGHFRFAVIYNFTASDFSDFLGIQAGIELGGGKVK
jgi:outer membrane protein W